MGYTNRVNAWMERRGSAGVAMLLVLAGLWWLTWVGRETPLGFPLLAAAVGLTACSTHMGERGNRRLLLSLAGAWALAEGGLRVTRPAESEDIFRHPAPYVGFRGKAGITKQFGIPSPAVGTAENVTISLNALGFRGPPPPMPKGRETRVIMIGGSAAFLGSTLSNTIPGHLERLCAERGRPDVRVYNWGVFSYVSGQELSLLVRDVADHAPDLVIVYDGANDVVEPWAFDPRPGYPFNYHIQEEALRRVGGESDLGGLAATVLWKSRTLRELLRPVLEAGTADLAAVRRRAGYRTPGWEDRIVSEYLRNVDRMAAVADGCRFRLLVCLQPVVLFKERREPDENRRIGSPELQAYVESAYDRIRIGLARMDQSRRTPHARFVDFSQVFRTHRGRVFTDFLHVTDDGNRVVAERLFEIVRPLLSQNRGYTRGASGPISPSSVKSAARSAARTMGIVHHSRPFHRNPMSSARIPALVTQDRQASLIRRAS